MRKYNFYFWLTLVGVLLLSSLNTTNGSDGYGYYGITTNLTNDEAIEIAKGNAEISNWLNKTSGLIVSVDVEFLFWHLIFKSQINNSYLYAIVDDISREVVSINYQNDNSRWYFYEDSSLQYNAENYFFGLDETSAFTDLNFEINVEYSGIANYIYVNGWKWDGNSNYNMNSLIKFNRTQGGEYTFSLAFIRSNIEFGTTNYTLDSAKEQAGTYQNVVDFYNNFTVNEVRVDQWLIKDDFRISIEEEYNLSGLEFGYYFVVRYQSWEYFEYRDSVTIGVTPTSDSIMPDIEIIYDESPWYEVILSDSTGAFVKEYGTVSRNYSYEEITNIVLSDPEIIDWIANLNTVTLYLYYNGYGLFYVDISTNNWFDRANFIISDETGEILSKNIQKAIYATKSSQDVLSIALSNPKISDWVLNTENYRVNYNYDFNGQWYLNFFDPIISDSWADLLINDTNGEILWAESYVGRSPEMTKDEVINAALSTDLSEFYNDYPDAKISMFYSYDDLWWVYVYSPVLLEEYILIQINDNTGRVNNIDNYKASRQPDSSYEDIETIMMGDETYQEFVSNYEVQYQSIIYYYNNWYVYVEGSDNDGFLWTLEMEIADYNLFVQNSWYYDTGEYYTRYPRGEEMQWQFGNQWDARYIGKHLSTPLGDVIEGYVLVLSSTTSSKNENTSPSLDLNGFELIPSLIAITFMIPVYLKRRK